MGQAELRIAPDVRAMLPTRLIEECIAIVNLSEADCTICGKVADEGPVSLVLRTAAKPGPSVQFAHEACGPSRIDDTPTPSTIPVDDTLFAPAQLPGPPPTAALFFEPVHVTMLDDHSGRGMVELITDDLRSRGWAGLPDGLDGPLPRKLQGWSLRVTAGQAELRNGDQSENTFDELAKIAGPDWLALARARRQVLVVVGSTLDLAHPDVERIDALVRDGKAVAAMLSAVIAG